MIYKGQEIEDKIWVTRYSDEYRNFYSNDFYIDEEDLDQLRHDLEDKKYELKAQGIEFKNLRFNFYATEYHENDYGPDDAADCSVVFSYQTPETDEESKERIEKKKRWIDEQITKEERKKEAAELVKQTEIQKAKETLKKYGLL